MLEERVIFSVKLFYRQAADLADRTSPDQAARLKEPLAKVNRRWEDLLRGVVDRQRELEHALLRLGQFQHALNELLVWIQRTDSTLDELKPVFGDPSVIEVELAKLKVLINDIQAHQTSVDTLNDAGRQLVETDKGSDDSNKTQQRLVLLNKKWGDLVEKASNRQKVRVHLIVIFGFTSVCFICSLFNFIRNWKMPCGRLSNSLLKFKTCCCGSTILMVLCPCRNRWVVYPRRHRTNFSVLWKSTTSWKRTGRWSKAAYNAVLIT